MKFDVNLNCIEMFINFFVLTAMIIIPWRVTLCCMLSLI